MYRCYIVDHLAPVDHSIEREERVQRDNIVRCQIWSPLWISLCQFPQDNVIVDIRKALSYFSDFCRGNTLSASLSAGSSNITLCNFLSDHSHNTIFFQSKFFFTWLNRNGRGCDMNVLSLYLKVSLRIHGCFQLKLIKWMQVFRKLRIMI